ncbi:uncharacterized protein C1orf198 homolog [Diorhabda sublineata]|uniref:uncharacterized protein C1orf198 homolog n=1 Tax=Diorhabda sublineata TaxID=1163346 RepID=UPI0024E14FA1|nr:uncharacterized protein C1orf198 homolog [Diorhabda sublineata]
MSLKSFAEDYFKNLNSISSRLHQDLEEIKASYEDLWSTLPEKEQQSILSESIIKPEISIKYCASEKQTKNDYAVKVIFDENCSYRDEHSSPFSFKTQSQRDLNIFCKEKENTVLENKIKLPSKLPSVKPKVILSYNKIDDNLTDVSDSDTANSLPKTGLDFLDNW